MRASASWGVERLARSRSGRWACGPSTAKRAQVRRTMPCRPCGRGTRRSRRVAHARPRGVPALRRRRCRRCRNRSVRDSAAAACASAVPVRRPAPSPRARHRFEVAGRGRAAVRRVAPGVQVAGAPARRRRFRRRATRPALAVSSRAAVLEVTHPPGDVLGVALARFPAPGSVVDRDAAVLAFPTARRPSTAAGRNGRARPPSPVSGVHPCRRPPTQHSLRASRARRMCSRLASRLRSPPQRSALLGDGAC